MMAEDKDVVDELKELKQKMEEKAALMPDIPLKYTIKKFISRIDDAEVRMLIRYAEYNESKQRFSNETDSLNYTGEPVEIYGKDFIRVTMYFVKEISLLIDILTESVNEVINNMELPSVLPPPEPALLPPEEYDEFKQSMELIPEEKPNETESPFNT